MERQHRFSISSATPIPDLVEAVRRGRREEFAAFAWHGECPDPQDGSHLPSLKDLTRGCVIRDATQVLHAFYTELLRLRRTVPSAR